jgi:hypothetical protein
MALPFDTMVRPSPWQGGLPIPGETYGRPPFQSYDVIPPVYGLPTPRFAGPGSPGAGYDPGFSPPGFVPQRPGPPVPYIAPQPLPANGPLVRGLITALRNQPLPGWTDPGLYMNPSGGPYSRWMPSSALVHPAAWGLAHALMGG